MAADNLRVVAAILVAAGSGERLGAGVPKAFVSVGGRTLLEHAYPRFVEHALVRDVVVVAPAGWTDFATHHAPEAVVVTGGATRQESVRHGLAALAADVELVLVHDVARAFVPADLIARVIERLQTAPAVVPVMPLADTIWTRDISTGELTDTVDRDGLVAVQTPQGFRRDIVVAAHAAAAGLIEATDDASLVLVQGCPVSTVPGSDEAFKITRPWDLKAAEALVARQP